MYILCFVKFRSASQYASREVIVSIVWLCHFLSGSRCIVIISIVIETHLFGGIFCWQDYNFARLLMIFPWVILCGCIRKICSKTYPQRVERFARFPIVTVLYCHRMVQYTRLPLEFSAMFGYVENIARRTAACDDRDPQDDQGHPRDAHIHQAVGRRRAGKGTHRERVVHDTLLREFETIYMWTRHQVIRRSEHGLKRRGQCVCVCGNSGSTVNTCIVDWSCRINWMHRKPTFRYIQFIQ